jgi:uncharacterized protein (TIGR02271 family)
LRPATREARPDRASETVELRAEELQARTRTIETGHVTLGKEVVEEQRTLQVPVTHEEVFVERHPVHRRAAAPIGKEADQTIQVPLRAEQVEVDKRPVVYEEVAVNTAQVRETKRVSETVRHEEARIARDGDVSLNGEATGDDARVRYLRELRANARYRDRSWVEIEPEVERDWLRRNPGMPWAQRPRLALAKVGGCHHVTGSIATTAGHSAARTASAGLSVRPPRTAASPPVHSARDPHRRASSSWSARSSTRTPL